MRISSLFGRFKLICIAELPFVASKLSIAKSYFLSYFFSARCPRRISVKVFCQVHDDSDVIEDWIQWHSHLFGFSSLYVITDRPSCQTKAIINKYSSLINVLESPLGCWPDSLGWDEIKTENLAKAMNQYAFNSDFVIPLDADEFISYDKFPSKNKIHTELERLKKTSANLFKFHSEYRSHTTKQCHTKPACEIMTFSYHKPSYDNRKCFARSASFRRIGLGQHNIYSNCQLDFAVTSGLCLIHFMWRGKEHMLMKVSHNRAHLINTTGGNRRLPRGGLHYAEGWHHYESGTFDRWIAEIIGVPSHLIKALSEFLS